MVPHRIALLLLAAIVTVLPGIAQTASPPSSLTFVPGSSVKLYQVTGDCDWVQWDATITSKTPTCKPTASKTLTNADVLGDDVPLVFEHNGEMIITFGDTIGAVNYAAWSDVTNSFLWNAHDPIAKSSTANASDGLLLTYFLTGTHGTEVSPPAQANGTKVDMGGFDTPSAGVSINGTIYLAVTTGNVEVSPGSDDMSSDYSVLTTFDETTQAFTTGRTISALPGGHFVAPSFYLAPAGALGTPPPVSPEPIVVIFGVGQYQTSNIYLSIVPSSEFWTGLDQSGNNATRYFSGMSNGQPTWSSSESSAVPVVFDIDPANPTIAHHSVFYSQPLNLWLMTFDGGRNSKSTKGIYFAYAPQPWGPWSEPQLIFNACRDKGLGNFMFYYYSTPAANDCAGLANSSGPSGPTIGSTNDPTTTRGTPYGPAIVGRFAIVAGATLKLFYLMATWNPYATVLMESDFTIGPPLALPSIPAGGVVPIYSKSTTIQPGSWASIYGSNLAAGTEVWTGNFPTTLGGTSVTIDGKLAYLWFVSSGQINFQAPDDAATGPVPVVVTTVAGNTSSTVTLARTAPSFLVLPDGVHVTAIVLTPGSPGNSGGGYDVIGPTRPVKAGETLVVYGVGFGPTQTAVSAGSAYAGATATTNAVSVTIGGVAAPQANVVFSGLVGAGLYQLNVVVPPNLGSGDKAIVASVGGAQTQTGVLLSLQ